MDIFERLEKEQTLTELTNLLIEYLTAEQVDLEPEFEGVWGLGRLAKVYAFQALFCSERTDAVARWSHLHWSAQTYIRPLADTPSPYSRHIKRLVVLVMAVFEGPEDGGQAGRVPTNPPPNCFPERHLRPPVETNYDLCSR